MPYPLDKIGTAASNKISSEAIPLLGRRINTTVVPVESLFFRKGLVIRSGAGNTGTVLLEGTHYILAFPCTTLAAYWGKPIYGGIFMLTNQFPTIYATYQTVGDIYSRGNRTLNVDLLKPEQCLRKTWEQVINVTEPSRPDLTLHKDTAGTMQVLMNTADAVTAEIQRLGKI